MGCPRVPSLSKTSFTKIREKIRCETLRFSDVRTLKNLKCKVSQAMADAPPKARTVHLSAAAKEAARKAKVADSVLVNAGLKRAQTTSPTDGSTAPLPKNKVGLKASVT